MEYEYKTIKQLLKDYDNRQILIAKDSWGHSFGCLTRVVWGKSEDYPEFITLDIKWSNKKRDNNVLLLGPALWRFVAYPEDYNEKQWFTFEKSNNKVKQYKLISD